MLDPAQIQSRWNQLMEENLQAGKECGASAVLLNAEGARLAEVHLGHTSRKQDQAWQANTLIPIYSASKGIASLTLLHVLHAHGLDPRRQIHNLWPSFPKAAFARLSLEQVLCHQGGLAWLDTPASVFEHEAVIEALEKQTPAWQPPSIGYHPRTWGFIVDELVRKISSLTLHDYFEQALRPLAESLFHRPLDFWFSLPESEHQRVAQLLAGKPDAQSSQDPLYQALAQPDSDSRRAFASPRGLHAVSEMNQPQAWETSLPAFGAVASARGLSTLYALLLDPQDHGLQAVRNWVQASHVQGQDRILLRELRFACGFQQDPLTAQGQKLSQLYGNSTQAFGHPGAGGSHAFVDPENQYAFAYVMNQMELSVLPGERARELVAALG